MSKQEIADIKMQHAIKNSIPSGKYIELKSLRNILEQENKTYDELVNFFLRFSKL